MLHSIDLDGRLRSVGQAWLKATGYSREEVMGRRITDFVTDATRALLETEALPRLKAQGSFDEVAGQMVAKSGARFDVVLSALAQLDAAGRPTGAVAIARNVTEQLSIEHKLRLSEARLRVLDELNQATGEVNDPEQILPVALAVLGRHLRASRCAFAHVDADGEWFTIPHDFTDGCASTAGRYRLSLFGARAVAELTCGRTLVVRDVDRELAEGEGAAMFNAIGIKAIVCCAFVRGGVLRAMMAVHQVEPRHWNEAEISIVQTFVERCWALIEQRRAETQLRRSEALLRVANRAANMGEWHVDVPSARVTWSDEACAIHGLPPGTEPTLAQMVEHFAPPHRETMRAHVQACIDQGVPFDQECQLITGSKRTIWVRAFGMAEHGPTGQVVRLQGALQDISERKAQELALWESHESLRVTLMSIGDAVITADPQGQVAWMNPVAERLTGWSADEARGRPLPQVFHIVNEETRLPTENPVATCLQQGKVVGLANHTLLLSRHGDEYGIEDSAAPIRDEAGRVLGVVLVFHDVTEQRRLSGEMSYRASHDALTGLINRAEFENRLRRLLQLAHEEQGKHAMMFIDLDQFKLVNDACGHSVGDQLLQQASRLLSDAVRSRDTVARLGGDEFGVLLDHCTIDQAQRIAQQICDRMDDYRFLHDGQRFRIGTSIGLVPVDNHWATAAAVMQAADTACYAAKEAGRNRAHTWFDTDAALRERHGEMQWTNRIEQALDEDRFVLFGQKILPLQEDGGGLRIEVLLRMLDANGGVILPGAFLPAAERYHLVTRVDRWVLRAATRWLAELPDPTVIDTLSINLSGQSIGDRTFHRQAGELLATLDADICQRLCLEITETAAITNLADAALFIEQMHALGVRITLDDFGAGASSFQYLKQLNVDGLKIDGQFIQSLIDDPMGDAAVRCFVDIARIAKVTTVAEFVDRQDVLQRTRELGIDLGQGFLLHEPEPLEGLVGPAAQRPASPVARAVGRPMATPPHG